jgi:hypothetical protein
MMLKEYNEVYREAVDDDHYVNLVINQSWLEDIKTEFYGYIIRSISSIGRNGSTQLFYITWLSQFFGLTRSGIQLHGRFGTAVALSTYDRGKKTMEAVIDDRIRYSSSLLHQSNVHLFLLCYLMCWF